MRKTSDDVEMIRKRESQGGIYPLFDPGTDAFLKLQSKLFSEIKVSNLDKKPALDRAVKSK